MKNLFRGAAAAAAAAGLLCAGAPGASANDTSLDDIRTSGFVAVGTVRENLCKASYVEDYKSSLAGYRINAKCDQLADFTKARAVNNYPFSHYVTTEWFTHLNSYEVSEWKPKTPLVTIKRVEMEYDAASRGLNVYLPSYRSSYGSDIKISVTTAPDEKGTVAVYWQKSQTDAVELVSGKPVDGRAELTIPGDSIPAGQQQEIFGVVSNTEGVPQYKTHPRPLAITKVPAPIKLSTSARPVPLQQGFDIAATLPRTATGTVTFTEADRVIATAEADQGKAALHGLRLPVGEHAITATYSGDANHLPATSEAAKVVVVNVELAITRLSEGPGGSVRLTARLPDGANGYVRFQLVSERWKGTSERVDVHDGEAEYTLHSVPTDRGPLQVYAHYYGDSRLPGMTSAPVSL